jgi:hypothetical protein
VGRMLGGGRPDNGRFFLGFPLKAPILEAVMPGLDPGIQTQQRDIVRQRTSMRVGWPGQARPGRFWREERFRLFFLKSLTQIP